MSVANEDFNPSQNPGIAAIKQCGNDLEKLITTFGVPCRRRDIALTHLETALMFAVKSVVDPD